MSWRDPVRRFLVSSVDDRELRRIWSSHDPERATHLPGAGASLAQLIDATVGLLTRERDVAFFNVLARERPGRSQEMDELAALWTARSDEPPAPAEGPRWFGSERFVGRAQELARLHDLLTHSRMVGITAQIRGLGGVGKTLLAVEYARRHGDAWPGGVFWIEADPAWSDAPPTGPERLARRHSVLAGFAASLGVAQIPGQPEASAAAVEQASATRRSPAPCCATSSTGCAERPATSWPWPSPSSPPTRSTPPSRSWRRRSRRRRPRSSRTTRTSGSSRRTSRGSSPSAVNIDAPASCLSGSSPAASLPSAPEAATSIRSATSWRGR